MFRMRAVWLGIPILLMMSSVAFAGNFTISYRNGDEVQVKHYRESGQSIIFWRYGGRIKVPKSKITQIRNNDSGALKTFAKPYTAAEIEELRKRQSEALERLPAHQLAIIQAKEAHRKELELKRQQLEEQRRQEERREREEQRRELEVELKQRELELRQEERHHQGRLEAIENQKLSVEQKKLNVEQEKLNLERQWLYGTSPQRPCVEGYGRRGHWIGCSGR